MSDMSSSFRRNPSFSQSGASTPSSDGGSSSQQGGSQSQTSTAQTTPAATPIDTEPKLYPATAQSVSPAAAEPAPIPAPAAPAAPTATAIPAARREPVTDLLDPLRSALAREDARVRGALEDMTRITHATQGPRGGLGLLVSHKSEVQNELNAAYTRYTHNVPGTQDTKLSVTVERNTVNLAGTTNVQGGTVTTGLTNSGGFTHLNSALTSTAGSTVGGLIGASPDGVLGAGFNVVQALNKQIGMSALIVGIAKPNGRAHITDVREGTAGVEHEQSNFVGGQAVVSVGAPVAGVAMRIAASAEVVRINQEDLPIAQAKEKLQLPWIKRKLIGLGLLHPSSSRHAIEHNADLARGKATSEERQQNSQTSMALSLGGVHLGIHSVDNQNSRVALSRSNSGNVKTLTVSRVAASTEAKTVDVPVLASGTKSSSRMQATHISLQLPDSQDAQPLIRRTKSVIGLNQSFEMPADIRPEEFKDIRHPLRAMRKVHETEAQSGLSIDQIQHSTREQVSRTRGSLMPLGVSLFGPLASINTEKGVADVYSVAASKERASIINGRERTVRTGLVGRGDIEQTASYLQVQQGAVVVSTQNDADPSVDLQKFSLLVAKHSFEQADAQDVQLLGKWSQSFSGARLPVSRRGDFSRVRRFSATAFVSLLLKTEDKLSLYEKGFFPTLAGRETNDASQQQQVLHAIDQRLNEMIDVDTEVVRSAAVALQQPERLQYDFEVNLVDNLALEANRLTVENEPSTSSASGWLAARKMVTMQKLFEQTEQSRQLLDSSLFHLHPEKREQLIAQLDQVQTQVLQTKSSMSAILPTTSPERPVELTAQDAREALAAPAQLETPDGDLGLVRMRSLETR